MSVPGCFGLAVETRELLDREKFLSWDTSPDFAGGNVSRHKTAGRNDCVVANGDAGKYNAIGRDPDILSNDYA